MADKPNDKSDSKSVSNSEPTLAYDGNPFATLKPKPESKPEPKDSTKPPKKS